MAAGGFAALRRDVIACRRCMRLVRWREETARTKVRRFAGEEYWGRPIPGFGDPGARLLIVGLAPAAHGGNRTGRMFTGDESGNWLLRALHTSGFANQPESIGLKDGLALTDCYITATCRCAPPQNKLLPAEILNCRPFLHREIALLKNVRVVVGLGRIGFDNALNAFRESGLIAFGKGRRSVTAPGTHSARMYLSPRSIPASRTRSPAGSHGRCWTGYSAPRGAAAAPHSLRFPPSSRKPVRPDVQGDVIQVIQVLACDEPDDVAQLPFGVMTCQASEHRGSDFLVRRQLRHVVQRSPLFFGEQGARPVTVKVVKLGLVAG